jgi:glycosyltransferase involved in cell wall biosynthesis
MRVLQAMAGAEKGGAESFFVRLVLALARAGLEQRVVMRRDARRAAALRAGGIAPVELSFGGIFDIATRHAFAREIESFRPNLVLTWMGRATRHCPERTASRRFVHAARLGGYYDLAYYRRCDRLVGNTRDIVAYCVAQGWPQDRVHYLPNFVDAAPLAPVARETLGTPGGAPIVLALGRLHENKAFDVLIRAMARLPGVFLWLAGEGPRDRALRDLARSLGVADRVRFLGWRDDVPALLAAADLLACPSRIEPLGNVIIEAWAHGKPVVAAAAAGPRELIEPERSGLLVPVEDATALADAIGRVLGDRTLAARLSEGGRADHEREFTEAAVVARYLEFFREVAF